MLTVYIEGRAYTYPRGTQYRTIVDDFKQYYIHDIYLVKENNSPRELNKTLLYDGTRLEFVTANTKIGNLTYRRSMSFVAIKALYDVAGFENIERAVVDFSVSKGYYIDVKGNFILNDEMVAAVERRMQELVEADLPIHKRNLPLRQAIQQFRENKMYDKERLVSYRRITNVNLYELDGYEDYFYGHMTVSTGCLKYFKLYPYGTGFVVQMPEASAPTELAPFEPFEKLFHIQRESSKWLEKMNVPTVGALNDCIVEGGLTQLILAQEAMMEKSIADIAERVCADTTKKFVMIAGPSSSGKTTFSYRLSVQLRAQGRNPHPIAVDNYYVNREDCPRDEDGNFDFECLEAIDVELFNRDMLALLAGETVELPVFNFKTGRREYKGDYLTLQENDILVIEGIHSLNDALSYSIPKASKFHVYISALTQLNIDEHNRIPTTDGRLLRRMVRDARTRNTSAKETIAMWNSVRRGEEKYIFPYQDDADVVFNSALVYELAVLKQYAEPLLFGIQPADREYDEAQRLLKFLDYFLGVDSVNIPINSLLREFIGGGCFDI